MAAGFGVVPVARAQDLPKKPDTEIVRQHRDATRGGIPQGDLKAAREAFTRFATYYADVIKHPAVWKASQEFKVDAPGAQVPTIDGPNGIVAEIDRFLIEPAPGARRLNQEPADYIREMGAAMDKALRNLIETHPERIVRVNAARVLAYVARTGALAHYDTATTLLAAPTTPTEVKHYLLQVAGAVLSAYDPVDIKSRRHSAEPKVVGSLVKVLQDCITNPAMLLPTLPEKVETAPVDQLAVLAFVRREAVRALAKVRFATIEGPDGKTPIFPAHTLARLTLADPAIVPLAGPAECAEAVIGICNMQPPLKGYNADVAVEAVASGLLTFASPRAADFTNRALPWRNYSLRLGEAIYKWRPLFDITFDITVPTRFDTTAIPGPVETLYKEAVPKVLARIEKADPAVNVDINVLREQLKTLRANPKRNTMMFSGEPSTSIDFAPAKN